MREVGVCESGCFQELVCKNPVSVSRELEIIQRLTVELTVPTVSMISEVAKLSAVSEVEAASVLWMSCQLLGHLQWELSSILQFRWDSSMREKERHSADSQPPLPTAQSKFPKPHWITSFSARLPIG